MQVYLPRQHSPQPQLLEVTASCANSPTFVLGTCVLLEPDAPLLMPATGWCSHGLPIVSRQRLSVRSRAETTTVSGQPQSWMIFMFSLVTLCLMPDGDGQHRGMVLAGPPTGLWLPRGRLRDLCFLCCAIKLSFAFKVPGPVIIQAIPAKILGPCSFEPQGQL